MNGVLLVDKPSDWTSHDVVAKLRGVFGERRIGHAGTLDPMATGLLVVFLGRATKAVSFAEAREKRYIARLRLGVVTDTQDTTGRVLSETEQHVTAEELQQALGAFRGEILQIPPMYSAIKVDGRRLYEVARRGGEVERAARPVTIRRLELIGRIDGDWLLDVTCSKGTYIRTLCHDLGSALGCGGAMAALRRISVGDYRVSEAHTVAQLASMQRADAQKLLMPLDSVFRTHPAVTLSAGQERLCRNGSAFACEEPDGVFRFYAPDGAFLMLGEVRGGTAYAIKRIF